MRSAAFTIGIFLAAACWAAPPRGSLAGRCETYLRLMRLLSFDENVPQDSLRMRSARDLVPGQIYYHDTIGFIVLRGLDRMLTYSYPDALDANYTTIIPYNLDPMRFHRLDLASDQSSVLKGLDYSEENFRDVFVLGMVKANLFARRKNNGTWKALHLRALREARTRVIPSEQAALRRLEGFTEAALKTEAVRKFYFDYLLTLQELTGEDLGRLAVRTFVSSNISEFPTYLAKFSKARLIFLLVNLWNNRGHHPRAATVVGRYANFGKYVGGENPDAYTADLLKQKTLHTSATSVRGFIERWETNDQRFSRTIDTQLANFGLARSDVVLVPVPSTTGKSFTDNFAFALGERLKITTLNLLRADPDHARESQKGKGSFERVLNRSSLQFLADASLGAKVAGRAVILVDDVLTTGATASAAAEALFGGADTGRVFTIALARPDFADQDSQWIAKIENGTIAIGRRSKGAVDTEAEPVTPQVWRERLRTEVSPKLGRPLTTQEISDATGLMDSKVTLMEADIRNPLLPMANRLAAIYAALFSTGDVPTDNLYEDYFSSAQPGGVPTPNVFAILDFFYSHQYDSDTRLPRKSLPDLAGKPREVMAKVQVNRVDFVLTWMKHRNLGSTEERRAVASGSLPSRQTLRELRQAVEDEANGTDALPVDEELIKRSAAFVRFTTPPKDAITVGWEAKGTTLLLQVHSLSTLPAMQTYLRETKPAGARFDDYGSTREDVTIETLERLASLKKLRFPEEAPVKAPDGTFAKVPVPAAWRTELARLGGASVPPNFEALVSAILRRAYDGSGKGLSPANVRLFLGFTMPLHSKAFYNFLHDEAHAPLPAYDVVTRYMIAMLYVKLQTDVDPDRLDWQEFGFTQPDIGRALLTATERYALNGDRPTNEVYPITWADVVYRVLPSLYNIKSEPVRLSSRTGLSQYSSNSIYHRFEAALEIAKRLQISPDEFNDNRMWAPSIDVKAKLIREIARLSQKP